MTNRGFSNRTPTPRTGAEPARISAGQLLVVLRRCQIPCSIDSLSAGGWTARLGDGGNGPYSQQGCFSSRDAAAAWLLEEAQRRWSSVAAAPPARA
jgi:hypothetical protein